MLPTHAIHLLQVVPRGPDLAEGKPWGKKGQHNESDLKSMSKKDLLGVATGT